MAGISREVVRVAPEDLHAYWPVILPGIQKIKAKCDEPWIAEDVYTALRMGGSTLLYYTEAGEYIGFQVVSVGRTAYSNKPLLNVWCGYCENASAYEFGEQKLSELAKSLGISTIRMESPRRGWEARGWEPVKMIYERQA